MDWQAFFLVQRVEVMTEWRSSPSISPLFGWGCCLRGLWSSISCPPIPGSFNLETAMECGELLSLPLIYIYIYLSIFFWRFRFPTLQLLPYGSMACVVAMCLLKIGWGGPWFRWKLFSFPCFLRRFLFKPLMFSFCLYFCKIPVTLCLSKFLASLGFIAATSALIFSPFQFFSLF